MLPHLQLLTTCPSPLPPAPGRSAPFTPHAQQVAHGGDAAAVTMKAIQSAEPVFQPGCMSELAQDFVRSCLVKRPSERPTIAQLLRHPWIRSFVVRAVLCVLVCEATRLA